MSNEPHVGKKPGLVKAISLYTALSLVGLGGVLLVLVLFAGFLFAEVVNADLYGRLTQTVVVRDHPFADSSSPERNLPRVRLVLHRILPDENAIEATVVIVARDNLATSIRQGKTLTAEVRDGSSYEPYELANMLTLTREHDTDTIAIAAQSPRFLIPALPSVPGFPFDDLHLYPAVSLSTQDAHLPFILEVQKSLPGRLVRIEGAADMPKITLTRSPTEKIMVLAASVVFFILSLVLAAWLFKTPQGLSTLEELLAVAGYLLAATEFRDLLGISRVAGTSALEVLVFGLPLVLLAIAVLVSALRSRRGANPGG